MFTKPYTPQHNFVCERKNKPVVEMVRCMLEDARLPKFLWAKSMKVVCHKLKRTPSEPLRAMKTLELWYINKPNGSHHVYVCQDLVHIHQKKTYHFYIYI